MELFKCYLKFPEVYQYLFLVTELSKIFRISNRSRDKLGIVINSVLAIEYLVYKSKNIWVRYVEQNTLCNPKGTRRKLRAIVLIRNWPTRLIPFSSSLSRRGKAALESRRYVSDDFERGI